MKFESQPQGEGEPTKLETEELRIKDASHELADLGQESFDFMEAPEASVAESPEVKEKFEELSETQHQASDLEQVAPFIAENNSELGAKVEEMKEEIEEKAEKSEQELEIARLNAEIREFNQIVQKSETMERFGAKHGFNKDETYAFVERMVLKNENRIRELENNKRLLRLEAEERSKRDEINRLKAEIAGLNKIVQNSETLEKFGAKNGFSRPDTYAYVEKLVKDNEERIRELEGSTTLEEKSSQNEQGEENQVNTPDNEAPAEGATETPAEVAPEAPEGGEPAPQEGRGGGMEIPEEAAHRQEGRGERPLTQLEQDHLLRSFEAERPRRNWWGWVKERAKGIATFGYWEFHQAERFRSNKKETAQEIAEAGENIRKTENLSLEDALEEAQIMRMMASGSNIERPGSEDYERFSQAISGEKIRENNHRIDTMVAGASASLRERLAKYRNEFGDVVVSDEEIMANFENELRDSLVGLQNGQRESDAREFNQLITRSLDPNYWRRYVYGALETLLAAWGLKVGLANLAASKWWLGKKAADVSVEAVGNLGQDIHLPTEGEPMNNTIWQTAKEWLQQNGVTDPTNKEIMDVSKEVATESHIGVKEWGIDGEPLDTKMQQGHLLKFGGASKVLLGIKIARGIASII